MIAGSTPSSRPNSRKELTYRKVMISELGSYRAQELSKEKRYPSPKQSAHTRGWEQPRISGDTPVAPIQDRRRKVRVQNQRDRDEPFCLATVSQLPSRTRPHVRDSASCQRYGLPPNSIEEVPKAIRPSA